ncbi:MAG: hypothetical protein RL463_1112 [Bacteroidota bacterium]|jgi:hypothetical protein
MKISIALEKSESSMIDFLHFQDGVLEAVFKDGSRYRYNKVRLKSLLSVLGSDSIGQGFHKYINGSYHYEKVE